MRFFAYKQKIHLIFIFIFLTFLSGCARKQELTLEQKLEAKGVRVIHVGETIRLTMSSDFLFMPDSANIQRCQYVVLKQVAQYLQRYRKVVVTVGAYTQPSRDPEYDKALTRQQAYNVVTFLWNHHVDARMMEGIGYGGQCLISSRCPLNRRVEIVFHYIPDYLHEMDEPDRYPQDEILP